MGIARLRRQLTRPSYSPSKTNDVQKISLPILNKVHIDDTPLMNWVQFIGRSPCCAVSPTASSDKLHGRQGSCSTTTPAWCCRLVSLPSNERCAGPTACTEPSPHLQSVLQGGRKKAPLCKDDPPRRCGEPFIN